MPHSLVYIWVHVVFSTKYRRELIHPSFELTLYGHICDRLENDFHCRVRAINGMPDHIHLLFQLNQNYALKDVIKNIKGESTHWINENKYSPETFAWQVGYGAFSVGGSSVDVVARYIRNQKIHHRDKSLLLEYEPIHETRDPV
ncbi:MAG: IS200/IS605 family transposase [Bacteroidota bacterium]